MNSDYGKQKEKQWIKNKKRKTNRARRLAFKRKKKNGKIIEETEI